MSRSGMPVGNEVFAGDRHDSTTLEERIRHIERLHGWGAAPLGAESRHEAKGFPFGMSQF